MKVLIVDLYGDGEILEVLPDTPESRQAVTDFDQQDKAYCAGSISESEYMQFSEFMKSRQVELFDVDYINLGPL